MTEIQTLQEQVPVNAAVSQPNFTSAMTNLASSPSMLGQIGAQVSSSATMKLMQQKGLELGNDPDGNLPILPINDYLKQLESSYNAQSQAVLGLRAQETINQANEVMARNPNITQEDIQVYKNSLQLSLDEISKMAPTGVRENLKNSFDSTLQSNTHQYVTKMIGEQQKEAASTQAVYIDEQQRKMQEAATSGDEWAAEDAYANALNQINERRQNKTSSPETHAADLRKLDILYHQSKMTHDAFEAQKKKGNEGLEKFLAAMPDKKPETMDYADYSTAMSGVVAAVNQREQLKSSNRSMIMSEAIGTVAVTGQPPTIQQTENMRNELTTQQFNETMMRINSALTQKNAKISAEDSLYNNRQNRNAWIEAGQQPQKKVFNRMTADEMQLASSKGQAMSEAQAMTNVAKKIPVATQAYTDQLRNLIGSASPDEAMSAARAYQEMTGGSYQDAAKVSELSDKAKVAAAMMNMNLSNTMTNEEKVALARNMAYNQTSEQRKNVDSAYARFQQEKLSGPNSVNKWVQKITGVLDNSIVHESSSLNDDVKAIHKKFYQLAGSNEDVAMQLTQDYVNAHYGYTNINGRKEYVLNPVERVIGQNTNSSIQLIHEDATVQLNEQLSENNKRFDDGTSDIKYEVETAKSKNGLPLTYKSFYFLLNEAQKAGSSAEAKEANQRFKEFQKEYYKERAINVKVTRRGNEPENMQLNIYPTRGMMQSENHEVIGGFDVILRDKSGLLIPFSAFTPNNINRIHYNADMKKIAEQAGSMPLNAINMAHIEEERIKGNQWDASLLANRRF